MLYADLVSEFNRLDLSEPKLIGNKKKRSKKVKAKGHFILYEIKQTNVLSVKSIFASEQNPDEWEYVNGSLSYVKMTKSSSEFKSIQKTFIQQQLQVKSVKKVINPFLKQAFELTRTFCYEKLKPVKLFHGTKYNYVDDICTYNFNWRYSGTERGNKYGKGVYFSKSPYFSSNFCDKKSCGFIIITQVLAKTVDEGSENLLLPRKGSDTATGGKRNQTFVKFYDDEFCPQYVVKFFRLN